MLPDLDIDVLRAFLAVAEARSFTKAAERLHRTQAAVSAQIKRLEEQLGQRLFVRTSRSVALTEDGEMFLAYAEQIVRINEDALRRFAAPDVSGTVRLGIPEDYATRFLPVVLSRFARAYHQIRLEVQCGLSQTLLGLLQRNELDLILITRRPDVHDGLVVRREPLAWVGSRQHGASIVDPVPLALYPAGACFYRELALPALEAVGRRWRVVYVSSSINGLRSAVTAGLAVTVLTRSALTPDMREFGLDAGFPVLPEVEITLHSSVGAKNEAAEHLRKFIVESFAPAPASGNLQSVNHPSPV